MLATADCILVPSTLKVQVLELPPVIVWPLVVEPRLKVIEQVLLPPVQALEVVLLPKPDVTPKLLPFSSSKLTPSKKAAFEGAEPAKVMVTVLTAIAPAGSAAKVRLAKLSADVLARPDDTPKGELLKVSLLRRTVIALPFGEDKVTALVALEVLPRATTVSATVSLAESVEVAILKIEVVLSEAPLEL